MQGGHHMADLTPIDTALLTQRTLDLVPQLVEQGEQPVNEQSQQKSGAKSRKKPTKPPVIRDLANMNRRYSQFLSEMKPHETAAFLIFYLGQLLNAYKRGAGEVTCDFEKI